MIDKVFCSSSFLMYRTIVDKNKLFDNKIKPSFADLDFKRELIKNSDDLFTSLKRQVAEATKDGKAALCLSGGIDSAILAKFMPKGSTCYTFRCIVPGIEVVDETPMAAKFAEECGLKHKVIEVYWEDFEKYSKVLMAHKGMPFHSIEVQIYKAALKAKEDGFTKLIFGENADIIYGGMNGLLAKDWYFGEFVDRYSYILPYKVLRNSELILEPYKEFEIDGHIDAYTFINKYFRWEALGTYNNACETAGIQFVGPYSRTKLDVKIDLEKIRSGNTKYLVREVFNQLYPNCVIPNKIPMPRATNEWFKNWNGPERKEFYPHCTDNMTGDQKWMVWILEKFLNYLDEVENNE